MERIIGSTFLFDAKKYEVVKYESCSKCAFANFDCTKTKLRTAIGECSCSKRLDNSSVMFKEITNMKNNFNKLTVDIPEGMEIDVKNSDLKAGIIKFRSKEITFEDVVWDNYLDLKYSTHNKLIAIAKLMDIAECYNQGWEPNWYDDSEDKFKIIYDYDVYGYTINNNNHVVENYVYFKNEKDAQSVIDNSDFRSILDEIYKN